MNRKALSWLVLATCAASGLDARGQERSVAAAKVDAPPLVSHEALEKRLNDAKLRLIDARPRAEYEKGHIPGAIWVDPKGAASLASKPGGLEDTKSWEAWVAPLGLREDSEILIYGGKSPVDASRTWWLLRYLGVERVGLVDGGFPLWMKSHRPVTTEERKPTPAAFKVRFLRERLATKEDVLTALKQGSAQIVDARSVGEFTGATKNSKRGGHIPEACHLEWSELVDEDGRFLTPDQLKEKMGRAGLKPGSAAITHCQGGGRASLDAFVLERLGTPTRNYFLGWSDWGNQETTPVATGPKPKSP